MCQYCRQQGADDERMIVCVSIADSKVRGDEWTIVCVSIADSKVRTMNG